MFNSVFLLKKILASSTCAPGSVFVGFLLSGSAPLQPPCLPLPAATSSPCGMNIFCWLLFLWTLCSPALKPRKPFCPKPFLPCAAGVLAASQP